jgi:general secretion pathway protein A
LLTNLETSSEKLVQIVLSGQPELEEKTAPPQRSPASPAGFPVVQDAAADQRRDTWLTLRKDCGLPEPTQPVLLPEAAELVYRYSKGIPRIINLICEQAMISAYVEQIKPIPAHIVESVGLELDLVQHPFTISFTAMQRN